MNYQLCFVLDLYMLHNMDQHYYGCSINSMRKSIDTMIIPSSILGISKTTLNAQKNLWVTYVFTSSPTPS